MDTVCIHSIYIECILFTVVFWKSENLKLLKCCVVVEFAGDISGQCLSIAVKLPGC